MADEKWSDLPAGSSVHDADYTAVVQGGANKTSTFSVIQTYIQNAFNTIFVIVGRTLRIGGITKDLSANRFWDTTDILDGTTGTPPVQGELLYRGASVWTFLPTGTS